MLCRGSLQKGEQAMQAAQERAGSTGDKQHKRPPTELGVIPNWMMTARGQQRAGRARLMALTPLVWPDQVCTHFLGR